MIKATKLPGSIGNTIASFASYCPMCGAQAQDRRYKRRAEGFVLTNRRFTDRTMTRECRVCGMRFSFTWKTFVNALRRKAELEENPKFKKVMLDRADYIAYHMTS